jgi:hypothetical protein
VIGVLKDIQATNPVGIVINEKRQYFAATRRRIIEMVRDNSRHVTEALSVYDASFADLVARQRLGLSATFC